MTAQSARCAHCKTSFHSKAARDDHEARCGANLAERATARAKVVRTVRQAQVAWEARDAAIAEARSAGMTLREIGKAAGLSHVQVMKICRAEEAASS